MRESESQRVREPESESARVQSTESERVRESVRSAPEDSERKNSPSRPVT